MQQASQHVVEIVTNLDDVSGEVVGHCVTTLLAEGALDVWTTAVSMKANRPGLQVSLLCLEEDRTRLAERMMALTGSFGVRHRAWERVVLDRRYESVSSPYGVIRMKVGELNGRVVSRKPEFADVLRVAEAHGVTPRQVLQSLGQL